MNGNMYEIFVDGDLVVVHFKHGHRVTLRNIIDALRAEKLFDAERDRNDLWDFRGCEAGKGLCFDSIMRIKNRVVAMQPEILPGGRTAILVDGELAYGMARMYEALATGQPVEVGVFYSEEEARSWLAPTAWAVHECGVARK